MITLSKDVSYEKDARGIRLAYIEAELAAPERAAPDPNDPALTRSLKSIPEFRNRILRVVHRPDGADIFVATARWDRDARR